MYAHISLFDVLEEYVLSATEEAVGKQEACTTNASLAFHTKQ